MAIMSENNVVVAHNPQSNLKLASSIDWYPKDCQRYYGWSGTDGSASNNSADMLEEVRLAATLQKHVFMIQRLFLLKPHGTWAL